MNVSSYREIVIDSVMDILLPFGFLAIVIKLHHDIIDPMFHLATNQLILIHNRIHSQNPVGRQH